MVRKKNKAIRELIEIVSEELKETAIKKVRKAVTEVLIEKERKIVIESIVSICQSADLSMADTAGRLMGVYPLDEKSAMAWVEKYWKITS